MLCTKNGKDDLDKFDARNDEAVFVCYSSTSMAYKVFVNKRTLCIQKSMHVKFHVFEKLNELKEEHNFEKIISKGLNDQVSKKSNA